MSVLPKPSFLTATAQIVPNILKPAAPLCVKQKSILVQKHKEGFLKLPKSAVTACNSIAASHHVRLYHTDVAVPDFNKYRKDNNKDPTKSNEMAAVTSRAFTYAIGAAGMVTGVYGGKIIVNNLLDCMTASADVLALAKIEVDLSEIPEGKNVLMTWRGKPLFVRHRTPEEIEIEKSVNPAELRDAQHDSDRVQDDRWLIVLGICTHLGCVPIANIGDYGGYYCPCHGSHYDKSGRIRKGPAPLNLEVPPYSFADENTLVVG